MKKIFLLLILSMTLGLHASAPLFEKENETQFSCNISPWAIYKINFGMEKIYIRFPHSPFVTQENGLLIGSSTHHQVLYKFIGYFPPIGNIEPISFLRRELDAVAFPPFVILGHTTYQVSSGEWVLDYIAHDTLSDMIIKHRSVVTPFNAYTLRAIFPNGLMDEYEFFLDSFRIHCTCNE